jgi:hypothetical protein
MALSGNGRFNRFRFLDLSLLFVPVKKLIPLFPQIKNFMDLRNDKRQYYQAQKNDGSADNRYGPPVVGRYVFKTKQCVPPYLVFIIGNPKMIKRIYPS